MLPRHQISEKRPREVFALAHRAEGGLPFIWTILPFHGSEIAYGIKAGKLFFARPFDAGVVNSGWCSRIRLG